MTVKLLLACTKFIKTKKIIGINNLGIKYHILRKYLKVNSDDLFNINSRDFRGFAYSPKVINIQ